MDGILKFVYAVILFLSLFLVVTNVESADCDSDYNCKEQLRAS
ncbi:putative Late nodulin [Medicago truncatula]|uniref:Nodule Cysteine-Rich (NCR) secreted peptide n=1 Tax=Medicago truncatula TaxID=3880 RepID=A0A072UMS5_MEDTR|nr:Nodule Cysteine-Rich (NCR) secreted peptide [Medicago truncatula]RHN62350.1 putative Late nodulin [Medicago truncatula]